VPGKLTFWRRRITAILVVAGIAAAIWVALADGTPTPRHSRADNLSTAELAGQRLITGFHGESPPEQVKRMIHQGKLAGVVLFDDNLGTRRHTRRLIRKLQSIRRPKGLRSPLMVMIDQEGGLVKRLSGAPSRSPAELGRIGSADLARREGRATAANLRDVGVNVNLAPVVDVGRRGTFQARTERSYSSNPTRVSAMAVAFVRGLQERGVAATLKHFPGLGTVFQDEDAVAQTVRLPLATLRRIDESPFVAGARAGVKLVMTSTAIYPALSPRPAMLSPRVSTAELRGQAGFQGVSITDDISVRALRRFGSLAANGREAAQAGNDLLLYCGGYANGAGSADALVRDARAGRLSTSATRASVRRILALRADLAR
jgi:beta-N-acetylhexosaminidase